MLKLILRLLLAGMFLWSAYGKFISENHHVTIYDDLTAAHPILSYVVPALEAFLGLWLLSGLTIRMSSGLALAALSAFSGLIIFEMTKEYPKPCGCFGTDTLQYDPQTIYRMLAFSLARNVTGIAFLLVLFNWRLKTKMEMIAEVK